MDLEILNSKKMTYFSIYCQHGDLSGIKKYLQRHGTRIINDHCLENLFTRAANDRAIRLFLSKTLPKIIVSKCHSIVRPQDILIYCNSHASLINSCKSIMIKNKRWLVNGFDHYARYQKWATVDYLVKVFKTELTDNKSVQTILVASNRLGLCRRLTTKAFTRSMIVAFESSGSQVYMPSFKSIVRRVLIQVRYRKLSLVPDHFGGNQLSFDLHKRNLFEPLEPGQYTNTKCPLTLEPLENIEPDLVYTLTHDKFNHFLHLQAFVNYIRHGHEYHPLCRVPLTRSQLDTVLKRYDDWKICFCPTLFFKRQANMFQYSCTIINFTLEKRKLEFYRVCDFLAEMPHLSRWTRRSIDTLLLNMCRHYYLDAIPYLKHWKLNNFIEQQLVHVFFQIAGPGLKNKEFAKLFIQDMCELVL